MAKPSKKEARNEGILFYFFDRGEPFLVKDFKRTIHRTSQNGILHINKHQWNNDRRRRSHRVAKKYPPMRINMTLYGASDETYERLCNNPKGFTQVTKALSLLKRKQHTS